MATLARNFQSYVSSADWDDEDRALQDGGAGYAKTIVLDALLELIAADFASLPTGVTIDGIEVRIDAYKDETGGTGTLRVAAELSWNNGSSYTTTAKKTTALGTTEATFTLGGATDTWGRSWTRAELQSGSFRLRLQADATSVAGDPEWRVDYAQATIYYTDTTALAETVVEHARASESVAADRWIATIRETARASDGGSAGAGHETIGLAGTAIDEIQSGPPSFQNATAQTNALHGLAAFLILTGPAGTRTIFIGDAAVRDAGFQDGVTEWGDILLDGSPGVDIAQAEALVRIHGGSVATAVAIDTIAGHLRASYGLAQNVYIFAYAREGATWFSRLLFTGLVFDIQITPDGVEIRAADVQKELTEIPTLEVRPGAFFYGAEEGTLPDQSLGQVVPIAWGRFDPLAVKAAALWPSQHPFVHANTDNQWLVAPMLGFKCPAVPAILCSDNYHKPSGVTPHPTMRQALFAFGDVRAPAIQMRTTGDFRNMRWPRSTSYFKDPVIRLSEVGLFTWDRELDRALPFLSDESTDLLSTERDLCGAGEYTAIRGQATAALLKDAQIFFVNRTNPNFPNQVNLWPAALQSIAVPPEKLSEIQNLTIFGTVNVTTSDVANPFEALNANPDTFASILQGGRLALEMKRTAPSLGDIFFLRVGILLGAGGTATAIDCSLRYYADHSTLAWPFQNGDVAADDHPTQTAGFRLVPSFSKYLVAYFWNPRIDAQLPGNALNWRFTHFAADPTNPGSQVPHEYGWDLVIQPTNGTAEVIHAWIDVIYRPRIGGIVSGIALGSNPALGGGRLVVGRGAPWGGPHTGHLRRGSIGSKSPRPTDPVAEVKPIDNFTVYISGKSAALDDASGTYTGTANAVVENPADIAGHVLAKYLGDFSSRAVGSTFGSFVRVRTQLDAKIGGGDNYRLSVVVKERTSVRALFDKLGEHSLGFIQRQPTGAIYEWRYFVDSHQPQTDAPERLYRTTGGLFAWNDFLPEGFRAAITPLDAVASQFVLNYGYHEPTGKYAYSKFVNAAADNLESSGSNYRAACAQSEARYLLRRQFVVDLPWVWSHRVADAAIKWHCNLRREPRVALSLTMPLSYIDLQPGHVIRLDDSIADRVKYPRPDGAATWSSHYFNVVSVGIGKESDTPVFVRVEAIETYAVPA